MSVINQRNCQPCTACCEGWLDVQTPVAQAHLGKACAHCKSEGCAIYPDRPQEPCQSFHCAWRQEGSLLPHAMRPDLSGVIVMTDQLQWQGEDVIVAVATGPRIPARIPLALQLGATHISAIGGGRAQTKHMRIYRRLQPTHGRP